MSENKRSDADFKKVFLFSFVGGVQMLHRSRRSRCI